MLQLHQKGSDFLPGLVIITIGYNNIIKRINMVYRTTINETYI